MTTAPYETGSVPEWTLGDRLRKAREIVGLDAQAMAAELDISRNSVGNWESGRSVPRRPILMAWAMRTGVPLAWLTGPSSDGDAVSPECARQDSNLQPSDPKSPFRGVRVYGVSADDDLAAVA